uniref:SET domain-containing protein n=1 Tax=Caenorhabditis tropicalis TaxID=1561998 RepID=A0A1I7TBM9_9PELO
MPVLSTLANGITEAVDTCVKIYEMKKGYKMTRVPPFPKVMKHTDSFKVVTDSKEGRRLGLTLANESFDKVCPESLEWIRKSLKEWFACLPEMLAFLEEPLPSNTIAVSYGESSFDVGDSCAKFREFKGAQGSLSYQKLSPNLVVTYFNKDDISFLAGITYFPCLNGKAKCFENDGALINTAFTSIETYPLKDRMKNQRIKKYKVYGRFCSLAKKRVLVDASGKYVKHKEYNHFWNSYSFTACEECLVDSVTYKWKKDPEVDPSAEIAKQLQELADQGTEISGTVEVFDTKENIHSSEKRIVDLKFFLKANPSFNVHSKYAKIAMMVLGEEFKDRIGGEPVAEVEVAEKTETAEVAEEATESVQVAVQDVVAELVETVNVAEGAEPIKEVEQAEADKPVEIAEPAVVADAAEPVKPAHEELRTCGGSPTPSDSEIERLVEAKASEENNVSNEEETSDESDDSENSDISDANNISDEEDSSDDSEESEDSDSSDDEDFERFEDASAEFDSDVDAEIIN